jgi:hypothetical protein
MPTRCTLENKDAEMPKYVEDPPKITIVLIIFTLKFCHMN